MEQWPKNEIRVLADTESAALAALVEAVEKGGAE